MVGFSRMKKFNTIVVGSGIAGLNFALGAAEYGKVLIVTKKRTVESSTNKAQGGIAAVLNKTDDAARHIKDTIEGGCHHSNKRAVEFMVKHGPEAIIHLIEIGVPFTTEETGELALTKEGGHTKRRVAFVGDYTGQEIEHALLRKVTHHPNITIWEHTFAVDLLVKNNRCYGIQAIQDERIHHLFAPNTILATGGIGQIYQYTTNPSISTGDGLAMGIRSGVKTKDLEFIQFHPTALKVAGRTKFLLSEALRGEGARLLDSQGERFMKVMHRRVDLAPRDVVARYAYHADLEGGVYLDMRHLRAFETILRFPKIYQKLLEHSLDLTKDLIPISPAAHYICGGLMTNLKGATNIEGLYAFGEVAHTGVHGANRLASNSLLEALVFSSQILPQIKKSTPLHHIPKFNKPTHRTLSPAMRRKLSGIRKKLRFTMWKNVGIIRNQADLKKALAQLKTLNEELDSIRTLSIPLQETRNMILVGEAIAVAALKRRGSLGNHFISS